MRKIFVDCGGYDGCSLVKFLLNNPDFECFTFEPNPVLWPHYRLLPGTLIKCAAYTHDGTADFRIDPCDGDGSSLIENKDVDFYGRVSNVACPLMRVPCVDLGGFLSQLAVAADLVILKLDVEGAEYEILSAMMHDGSIQLLKKLYCEFHWDRIQMPRDTHEMFVGDLAAHVEIEEWDSLEFSVYQKGDIERRRRLWLTTLIWVRRIIARLPFIWLRNADGKD